MVTTSLYIRKQKYTFGIDSKINCFDFGRNITSGRC